MEYLTLLGEKSAFDNLSFHFFPLHVFLCLRTYLTIKYKLSCHFYEVYLEGYPFVMSITEKFVKDLCFIMQRGGHMLIVQVGECGPVDQPDISGFSLPNILT